jgi:hypothetical protein
MQPTRRWPQKLKGKKDECCLFSGGYARHARREGRRYDARLLTTPHLSAIRCWPDALAV